MSKKCISPYPHQLGGHCGSGALRDLLHWAGLGWGEEPGEGLVFGLGGGLSFMYTRYPGLTPPIYLVGRNADMELNFCHRLGIATELQQSDDADTAWQTIRAEIDAGRPVMVWADIAELPYLRVRLSNTRHVIVVMGYDDEQDTVMVVDNDREQVQEIPLAAFKRAHGSNGFPGPNRCARYPMSFPDELPDLLGCARSAASNAARVLGGEDALLFDTSTLPAGSLVVSGVDGVQAFADDLPHWPELMNPEELNAAFRSIPVFIEKAGTGGGFFRRLEADFCRDVARLTGDAAFADAGEACQRAADSWSALGELARAEQPDIHALTAAAQQLPKQEAAMQQALASAGKDQ